MKLPRKGEVNLKVILDRFEEDFALVELENKEIVNIPRILVSEAEEGDIIEIRICKEETRQRQEEIEKIANDLFE
jgi:hypothetical protein